MRAPGFVSIDGFIAHQDFVVDFEVVNGSGNPRVRSAAESLLPTQLQSRPREFYRIIATCLALIGSDLVAVIGALLLAMVVASWLAPKPGNDFLLQGLLFGTTVLIAFAAFGLYPGIGLTPAVELRQIWIALTLLATTFSAATSFYSGATSALVFLCTVWAVCLLAIPVLREMTRHYASKQTWWGSQVLIFGAGPTGAGIYRTLVMNPSWGLRPVGIVDDCCRCLEARQAYLGSLADAADLLLIKAIPWAVVAMPERSRADVLGIIETYASFIPNCLVVPDLGGLPSLWTGAADCGGLPGLQLKERLLLPLPRLAKRATDFLLTITIALIALPLLAALALMVKLNSPGSVFYAQERLGFKGRRFRAWKFRTMIADADQVLEHYLGSNPNYRDEWQRDHKLKHDPRITAIGRFLRKTSLDELPQIWNVLRGEMSLVGPRPIVTAEIPKYGKCYDLYQRVRPGITGLWQVSGRNNTTYEERVQLDGYYVRNWSPWLDLCILAATVKVVLLREGAY
jgi:Undecaprenyl-phosphate galactose phosphotransferase WbaP